MRVTLIDSYAQRGGAEKYFALLADYLARRHVVSVICLGDGPLVSLLEERGHRVAVVRILNRRSLNRLPTIRSLLARDQIVVLANGTKAAAVSAIATFGTHSPLVWRKCDTTHDGWRSSFITSRSTAVIGVSHHAIDCIPAGLRDRCTVIYNGVTPPALGAREARASLNKLLPGADSARPLVAIVGRLSPEKGQLDFVSMATHALRLEPDLRFLVIGECGPHNKAYRVQIEQQISVLGLGAVIHVVGHIDQVSDVMAGLDVCVVPSSSEGFGLAPIEALAAGTPVVAYAAGSLPEILGSSEMLVPPGDSRALAETVVALLRDPERAERVAAEGRMRAQRFSLDSSLSAYEQTLILASEQSRRDPSSGAGRAVSFQRARR